VRTSASLPVPASPGDLRVRLFFEFLLLTSSVTTLPSTYKMFRATTSLLRSTVPRSTSSPVALLRHSLPTFSSCRISPSPRLYSTDKDAESTPSESTEPSKATEADSKTAELTQQLEEKNKLIAELKVRLPRRFASRLTSSRRPFHRTPACAPSPTSRTYKRSPSARKPKQKTLPSLPSPKTSFLPSTSSPSRSNRSPSTGSPPPQNTRPTRIWSTCTRASV
jgi:hypothetical protein